MPALLTKSDFQVARTCPTKLYYKKSGYASIEDDDPYLQLLATEGQLIQAMAQLQFPGGRLLPTRAKPLTAAEITGQALDADPVILFEPTFISGDKLARIDILVKNGKRIEVIEVKTKTFDYAAHQARLDAGKPALFRADNNARNIRAKWRPFLEDITFQVLVLRELFPDANIVPYLMLPDRNALNHIEHLHTQFVPVNAAQTHYRYVGNPQTLARQALLVQLDVSAEVAELLPEVAQYATTLTTSLRPVVHKIDPEIGLRCKHCEYNLPEQTVGNGFRECWGAMANASPHILELQGAREYGRNGTPTAVRELLDQGQAELLTLNSARLLNTNRAPTKRQVRQVRQIEQTRRNEEWFSDELPQLLREVSYPLHFIDFETAMPAIPHHGGMRPYEQIAFQWSCHTIRHPNSPPEHAEWINMAPDFPNFRFAESLLAHLGNEGTLFMWATHENTVLRKIRKQMAERSYYHAELDQWLAAVVKEDAEDAEGLLVDMNAITQDHYFHPAMKGRTSIKIVSDAIWQHNPGLRRRYPDYILVENGVLQSPYKALPAEQINGEAATVAEGTAAIQAYQAMLYGAGHYDPVARDQWRNLLLRYCALDTLSMVMVWEHWTQITG